LPCFALVMGLFCDMRVYNGFDLARDVGLWLFGLDKESKLL